MAPSAIAWIWLLGLALVMGALIFGAAGDLRFWQGWAFLAVFFAASALITQYLITNDPALLQRRVREEGKPAETEPAQRLIMVFMSFGFVALIVLPGLDHRFGWSQASAIVALTGDALIAVGFFVIFLVFKANSFASSTIGVAKGQSLVSTGPYAVVRHPMYAAALIYFLGVPLALGSYWGLVGAGADDADPDLAARQ